VIRLIDTTEFLQLLEKMIKNPDLTNLHMKCNENFAYSEVYKMTIKAMKVKNGFSHIEIKKMKEPLKERILNEMTVG